MINKINTKIILSNSPGLIHDSRKDIRTLSKMCNELINKVNELTDEINKIKRWIWTVNKHLGGG